jgi:hypothetical protein
MNRWMWLFSLSFAGAAALAWIVFVTGGLDPGSTKRHAPADRRPAEPTVATRARPSAARVPIEPVALAIPEPPADDAERPASEAPVAPKDWPPQRAFTERCRARGGTCPAGCRELAGGRCLDPCFIHTPECSRDCLLRDGTCGFPPPDSE